MDLLWACELEHLKAYAETILKVPEDQDKIKAFFFDDDPPDPPAILSVDGDTATIDIKGTLTNRVSLFGRVFGFNTTTYTAIQEAIADIQANEAIKRVRLAVDSPGGNVTGLDETWIAIRELAESREVVAENQGLMASAAYWLASAADRIVANSPSAETGSIGVYMLVIDDSKMDDRIGIKEVRIVSKNAPLKNPDVRTKAGVQALQDRLDALERVFIDRVATGREVSTETVEKDFGRGALLIAQDPDPSQPDALSVGMIDEVTGIAAGAGKRDKRRAEAGGVSNIPAAGGADGKTHVDKHGKTVEKQDHEENGSAAAENRKDREMAKLAELTAKDPDLQTEVDGLIAAAVEKAKKEAAEAVKPPSEKALAALASDGTKPYIRELAVKVIKGEAKEADLLTAQGAYDAALEQAKADAAANESEGQGGTPPAPPIVKSTDGSIATEEDFDAAVARQKGATGMEEK